MNKKQAGLGVLAKTRHGFRKMREQAPEQFHPIASFVTDKTRGRGGLNRFGRPRSIFERTLRRNRVLT